MAISRITVWSPGNVLTAQALNAEFDNVLAGVNVWPASFVIGDMLYASSTSALSALAGVATGNSLLSGGVGAAPAWGKVGLTTHVSGILPTANGGTGIAHFTAAGPTVARVYTFPDVAGSVGLLGVANTWTANQSFDNLIGSSTTGAVRLHNLTTAQRDALTPAAGQIIYNTSTSAVNVYTGSWGAVGGGASGGKQQLPIPASALTPRITNGPSRGFTEQSTNKNNHESLDFDTTTQEFAQIAVAMPNSWNEGTVTFIPYWTAASGSGTVVFGLAGVATSNDDALDVAFGTAQTSTDTLLLANDNHAGPESAAITIAGTPAANDYVTFQINRTVADDTLGVDAKLLGLLLIITTDADTDA